MLTVNKKSWHARLYSWWYKQKYGKTKITYVDRFDDNQNYVGHTCEEVPNEPERTNLCPYMRAVMFWSWMRWLFIGGKVWKIPVPAVVIPFLLIEVPRWLGILSYNAKMATYFIYGVLACVAIIVGVICFLSWLDDEKDAFHGVKEFGGLLQAYGRSTHDRICPEVAFTEETNASPAPSPEQ